MNFKKNILSSGLTIITVPQPSATSVTVLVMVSTGSKYETKEQNGLSHFLEHMVFKGTPKRPTPAIITRELDALGSQNNAFTTHEFTGYYAKAHPKHIDRMLDIISDMYQNPIFEPKEIEKEKGVIIEEMHMYEDRPDHMAYEIFLDIMHGDQPAGWPVIGNKENIMRTKQDDFFDYRKSHYVAGATTVIISGNFEENGINEKVQNYFKNINTGQKQDKLPVIENQTKPRIKIKHKETDQAHLVLGVRTFRAFDERESVLRVLNSVLGSHSMSSRLFQKLREEMGVGYYVRSHEDEYTDHGHLAVLTGVDTNRVEEVIIAILGEMKKLANELVPEDELQKAKDFAIGNMYLGLESSDALGEFYGIQHIVRGEILTPEQIAERMQNVTALEVLNLAKEIMSDKGLNMAIVGNIKNPEALEKIFHF